MTVREGVTWHDGSPFTAEDVAWSLARVGRPGDRQPDPVRLGHARPTIKVDGNTVTADVAQFEPTIFKWMYFLTGYVLPKAYYEKVGAEGFEAAPIGTGPYMVEKFERNAFVRLKANAELLGRQARLRDRDDQVRDRCRQPRGRDRIRQLAMSRWKCPTRNMTG